MNCYILEFWKIWFRKKKQIKLIFTLGIFSHKFTGSIDNFKSKLNTGRRGQPWNEINGLNKKTTFLSAWFTFHFDANDEETEDERIFFF
jgi:hypothetical protein